MKPGDVVELKQGSLGLEGDDLYAIYLDRTKRSKEYLVVLYTAKGRQELSRENVKRTVVKSRVDDPESMSESELSDRLTQLVQEITGTPTEERGGRRHDIEDLDDRRLWELIVNDVTAPVTAEQAARMLYEDPTREQIGDVRSVLRTCERKGVGYFERAGGSGERYEPYTVDEIKAIRREIDGVRKLRNELIQVREVPPEDPEDEDAEPRTLIEGLHPDEADLSEDDRRRLALVTEQMRDFVLHDRDRGEVGLAGTPVHTLDGFILNRFCRFLAFDWLGDERTSISGAYVRFLLETGQLSMREANDLVARRHVNLAEHASWTYPDKCLRAAERLPGDIPDAWRAHRRDLTELETYTIDPATAEDFDDAVSLVPAEDGEGHQLFVHIADVAQYVEPGSRIDFEARSRGTSVYLPTGVLPMLPPRLSEDLCSLRAEDERPAMTVRLDIDAEGQVTGSEVFESIIEVDANKAYPEADEAIEAGEEPFASLHALASRMREQRLGLELETDELQVHIDHESVDPHLKSGTHATRLIEQFMVAANEAIARTLTEAELPTPYRCHPLPERHAVATFNRRMRVMEQPFELALPNLEDDEDEEGEGASEAEEDNFLEALEGGKVELVGGGFVPSEEDEEADEDAEDAEDEAEAADVTPALDGLAQLDEEDRAAFLEPFGALLDDLDTIEDDRMRELIHLKLLGCLGRAFYTPRNIGHFGLGSTCYTHFTSPIRRYPDLVVHRQLKHLLRRDDEEAEDEAGYGDEEPPHDAEALDILTDKNTEQTQEAEQLERDLIAVAMAFDAVASTLPDGSSDTDEDADSASSEGPRSGLVNGITKGGVFMRLENGLETRLATSDIPGGPWSVDAANAMLFKGEIDSPEELTEEARAGDWREMVDEDTGEMVLVRMRLGDAVSVELTKVDLAMGQVACRLAGGAGRSR